MDLWVRVKEGIFKVNYIQPQRSRVSIYYKSNQPVELNVRLEGDNPKEVDEMMNHIYGSIEQNKTIVDLRSYQK